MVQMQVGTERGTPLARALDRVVDAVAGEQSPVRVRQLRMVVGMWDRALLSWRPGAPAAPRSVAGVFADDVLHEFWDRAVAGELRVRAGGAGDALAVASRRVVRDCLGILADGAVPGRAVWLPVVVQPEPRSVVPRRQLGVMYRRLVDMASDAPVERAGIRLRPEHRARLLAMVAVVLDTGCRSVELQEMRLDDLADGLGVLVVRRHAQNGSHLPVAVQECALRDGTQVALRRWLRVRAGLVDRLEGTKPDALWVGLTAGRQVPAPGFPLKARGIQRSYATGAVALNHLMAGRRGWSPLPTTLEQLRRAVAVRPVSPV